MTNNCLDFVLLYNSLVYVVIKHIIFYWYLKGLRECTRKSTAPPGQTSVIRNTICPLRKHKSPVAYRTSSSIRDECWQRCQSSSTSLNCLAKKCKSRSANEKEMRSGSWNMSRYDQLPSTQVIGKQKQMAKSK